MRLSRTNGPRSREPLREARPLKEALNGPALTVTRHHLVGARRGRRKHGEEDSCRRIRDDAPPIDRAMHFEKAESPEGKVIVDRLDLSVLKTFDSLIEEIIVVEGHEGDSVVVVVTDLIEETDVVRRSVRA